MFFLYPNWIVSVSKQLPVESKVYGHKSVLLFAPFLVPDDLDGHHLAGLVVQTFEDLTKGTFPDHLQNLEPVANMVMQNLEYSRQAKKSRGRRCSTPGHNNACLCIC